MKKINWTKWGTIISLIGLVGAFCQLWQQHDQIQNNYTTLGGKYDILAQSSTVMQQEINSNSSTIANIVKSKVGGSINSPNSPTVTVNGNNAGPIANGQNAAATQNNYGPIPQIISADAVSPNVTTTSGFQQVYALEVANLVVGQNYAFTALIGDPRVNILQYTGVTYESYELLSNGASANTYNLGFITDRPLTSNQVTFQVKVQN